MFAAEMGWPSAAVLIAVVIASAVVLCALIWLAGTDTDASSEEDD